jgi:hypothetical protein
VSSICTACGTIYDPKPPKWLHCDLDKAPIRPDGQNEPVATYTETEIREAMGWYYADPDIDHVIELLKEHRNGRQAHLHPNLAQR